MAKTRKQNNAPPPTGQKEQRRKKTDIPAASPAPLQADSPASGMPSSAGDPIEEAPESIEGAPQAAGDTTASTPDRERIARRAYELYQARGGGEGSALDDWLAAEQELDRPGKSPEE